MDAKVKRRLKWAGGGAGLLFVCVLLWWLWFVQVMYGYWGAAWVAGEAYGFYFNANSRWPESLPVALEYARVKARPGSRVHKAVHRSWKLLHLSVDELEACPGLGEDLSPKREDWESTDMQAMEAQFKYRFVTPVLRRGETSTSDLMRREMTRHFYGGIRDAVSHGEGVGVLVKPEGKATGGTHVR